MKVLMKKVILIACVIILLSIPIIIHITGIIKLSPFNKFHKQAVFPHFTFNSLFINKPGEKSFSDSIEQYYSAISGFRELLVPVFLVVKNELLHVSPYPRKVVYGQNGWFFLGDEYSNVIRESKGLINFTEKELRRIHENMLETKEYCRRRNIKFYLAMVPDKSVVYGCYLPIEKADRPTKLDQVKSRLKNSDFNVIDLGKDFMKYNNRELYLKTDSHWNQFGLFIGYQTLMNEIKTDFPDIQVLKLDQFMIDNVEESTGDLTAMISLERKEQQIRLIPKFKTETTLGKKKIPVPDGYPFNPKLFERRFFNKNGKYKALIIHDSFFKSMPKFMKESFRESVFIWCYFNYRIIDDEKPDLIIYELAGREIDALLQDHVVL
ncbi:MAG: hypothetical protein M0Q38_11930 [Bacteroidales bacterium]|jgi:hypothetical protein|nr:hypothetical protein [Bacteroidales bacterium]